MLTEILLTLSPEEAANTKQYTDFVVKKMDVSAEEITMIKVLHRSIDARSSSVKVHLRLLVAVNEPTPQFETKKFDYQDVSTKPEVIVVGCGPAGLFAALRLIELGFKPILLERGKEVKERRRDIAQIYQERTINTDSNFCFGEGGAGTFSDGKLYTRSKKRGDSRKILEVLHFHGAVEDILIDAHPHIGTNRLPAIISNIRASIEKAGGVVMFNTRVTDLIVKDNTICGLEALNTENQSITTYTAKAVILATGHSARDVYRMLHQKQILIEAKPFALGVRVEHPQELIDSIQYKSKTKNPYLPAASYNLVTQVAERGVYSFCMCPGGHIVPAATSNDELVVNGMSPALRNSKFANSGMVVEIRLEDLGEYQQYGALAGLEFQQSVERNAFQNGGFNQTAPAQALADFVKGKVSGSLPETSYKVGVVASPLHFWLPEMVGKRLQKGFDYFGKVMRGYLTNEALILGVESRTSSAVRIPRDEKTMQHTQIQGLFPCGEGAGYAGGIVSAAIDGERCAEKAADLFA